VLPEKITTERFHILTRKYCRLEPCSSALSLAGDRQVFDLAFVMVLIADCLNSWEFHSLTDWQYVIDAGRIF
jgi:hypothetical protein